MYDYLVSGKKGYASTGKKIRMLRKAANLTQTELGSKLGVKPDAVSKWECGRPVWRLGIRRASPRWLIAVSRGMAGRWWALAFARLAAC